MQTSDETVRPQPDAPRRRGPRPRATFLSQDEIRLRPAACRRRRPALGLSTYELAQQARLDEQTVVRFEAALSKPRQVTVVALHNALRRIEAAGGGGARRSSGSAV